MRLKTPRKWVLLLASLFLVLVLAGVLGAYWYSRAGSNTLVKPGSGGMIAGLSGEVRIDQDAKGIPTIRSQSTLDAYRAQGWIVARDRFFQMDLMRRATSGRLSEILGSGLVSLDRLHRWARFQFIAEKAEQSLDPAVREEMLAYADGVNAFLQKHPETFESKILGYHPEPWKPSDSILVALSLFEQLDFFTQYGAERIRTLASEKRAPSVLSFLFSDFGYLDSPQFPDAVPGSLPLIPGPEILDIRKEKMDLPDPSFASLDHQPVFGSNAWALSGKKTQSGNPILAGDPHLAMMLPSVWYRIKLVSPDFQVTGVAIPGMPGIVIGHSDFAAWTFTTASGDSLDLVELTDRDKIEKFKETLPVRFGKDVEYEHEWSEYGPVYQEINQRKFALKWVALDPNVLSKMSVTPLMKARSHSAFKDAMRGWTGPIQNLIYTTQEGDFGWQVVGVFPKRVGIDGKQAFVWDEQHRWDGYQASSDLPGVENPSSGVVANANQRMISNDSPMKDWFNNYPGPSRGFRIREVLAEKNDWTLESMNTLQLDRKNHEFDLYYQILTEALQDAEAFSKQGMADAQWLDEIRKLLTSWKGEVALDLPSYVLIRKFRTLLVHSLLSPILGIAVHKDPLLDRDTWGMFDWFNPSPALRALWLQKPLHLLTPPFTSYPELVLKTAVKAAKALADQPEDLETQNWGDHNRVQIGHAFSKILPDFLAGGFRVPITGFDGDHWSPKVGVEYKGFFHSASIRWGFEQGKEEMGKGYLQFPGGQSGHYLSSHFKDQYDGWLRGSIDQLEPGKAVVEDVLTNR